MHYTSIKPGYFQQETQEYEEASEDNGVSDNLPRQLTFLEPNSNLVLKAELDCEMPLRYSVFADKEYHPLGLVERNENGTYTVFSPFHIYTDLLSDASTQLENLLRMY